MAMRRTVVVLVLGLVAGVWPAASGAAHGSTATQAPPARSLQADFNNDGADDLAVGVPLDSVGAMVGAGAVNVLYGSASGLTGTGSQLFTQVGGAVEAGDGFGFAMAGGDFNGDTFTDLGVGAPFEDVGGTVDAGAVSVLPGSAGGLTPVGGRLFTQDIPGVPGSAQELDFFGFTVATGDPGPAAASGPTSRAQKTASRR
jgi:FG-GAP repeat